MKVNRFIPCCLLLSAFHSFTIAQTISKIDLSADQQVEVIELRNYILKPGQRVNFIDLFEANFIRSQQQAGSYTLGQFRLKGYDDNFFWIRGFNNMTTRFKALNEFYHGEVWKQNKVAANSLIINNDNVHLLKPLDLKNNKNEKVTFNTNWFGQKKGIGVIDYYISNTKLDKLTIFVRDQYTAILDKAGMKSASFWISETINNDFPGLPVFQDRNLLVQITFYKDESEYQDKMKLVDSLLSSDQKADLSDLITLKNTFIIYPTVNSFSVP